MTDRGKPFDENKFDIFARIQIRSGRCLMVHCTHFDHTISPSSENEHCVECYNRAMARLEKA